MKKVIPSLITILAFTSCETKYCWKCTISSQATTGNYSSQTTTTICDKTRTEAEDYEKAGTMTTTSNGISVVTTTDCQIQN